MAICVKSEKLPNGQWVAFWRPTGRHAQWYKIDGTYDTWYDAEIVAARKWHAERMVRIAKDRAKRASQAQRAAWGERVK